MATIYAASQLLREAFSKESSLKNTKLHCFEYFSLLHLHSAAPDYNQGLLDLLSSIVAEDRL